MKVTYYLLPLLLLPLGCMAQINTPMNSLENEIWETSESINPGSTVGTRYYFLGNGKFAATTYYSGGAYLTNEWEGKYTYILEKEEVYLSYQSQIGERGGRKGKPQKVTRKECIKLKSQVDVPQYEVCFYSNWEKKGQQYAPVGEPKTHIYSTKISTEKGYTLSEGVDEKPTNNQGINLSLIPRGSSFSRQKDASRSINR